MAQTKLIYSRITRDIQTDYAARSMGYKSRNVKVSLTTESSEAIAETRSGGLRPK